jgi:hypothetical protein
MTVVITPSAITGRIGIVPAMVGSAVVIAWRAYPDAYSTRSEVNVRSRKSRDRCGGDKRTCRDETKCKFPHV